LSNYGLIEINVLVIILDSSMTLPTHAYFNDVSTKLGLAISKAENADAMKISVIISG